MSVIGNEPEADLSAFYQSPEDPVLKTDLQHLKQVYAAFESKYKGRIASLTASELADAIEDADRKLSQVTKIGSYSDLKVAKNSVEFAQFGEMIDVAVTESVNHETFFSLELNAIDDAVFEQMLKDEPRLARYETTLRAGRKNKPHELSEAEEKLNTIKDMTGRSAWIKLFDEVLPNIKFEMDGKPVKMKDLMNLMSESTDRDVREKAYRSISAGMKAEGHILTYITNILALDKANMDKIRKYPHATSARNLGNNIEDDVVDALNDSIVANYSRTAHRYYELKRQILQLPKMAAYDRNAPIGTTEKPPISYEDGKKIVLESYREFSPYMADIVQMFFDKNWIDARATDGKDTGAFSHPTSVDCHPVIYMNWTGTNRDVLTLAHELGHGVQQYMAAKKQKSQTLASTPLTLAETSSIFGEQMVFERLLAAETDPSARKELLASKIEDMLNSVVRQIAFYNFEKTVHEERRSTGQRLSEDRLGEIWMKVQQDSLGPAFEFDDDYKPFWSYIPHFIHSPFYVYAYAFGDAVVNALYNVYKTAPDKEAFKADYLGVLQDGGSKRYDEALAPFGIKLDRTFWDGWANVLNDLVVQLEQAIAEEKALKTLPAAPTPTPA